MMKALNGKRCLFLVALGVTLTGGASARGGWFYDFNDKVIPSSLTFTSYGDGYTPNNTLTDDAQGGFLRLKDKNGKAPANGGILEVDVDQPEVFTGDVRVTAQINADGKTNDVLGLAARIGIGSTTGGSGYWAAMSFSSNWLPGKLYLGKNVGSLSGAPVVVSQGQISNLASTYFLELSVTDSTITGYTTVTGHLYGYEGGPSLLDATMIDTNLGGIPPWKSGTASVWASPGPYPDALNATFDNIRAVGVPEPSTLLLLSTGSVGLLAVTWRRKRAA
jgi:hypothetical protein